MKLATDETGVKAPVVGFSEFLNVSLNTSTSATAGSTVPVNCNVIRIVSNVDCYVIVGSTANKTTSMFLPAFSVEFLSVVAGNQISAIGDTEVGILNIGFTV